eukprot:scaffold71248_cov60-Phaeocystis_antarctica.AAC.1
MPSSFFQSRGLRSIALYLLVSAHSSEASPPSPPPFSPLPTAPDVLSTEAEGMRALSESGCTDLDGAATDADGNGCSLWREQLSVPGLPPSVRMEVCTSQETDDADFSLSTMCCACGGGALPPSPPPSPPSQPSPPAAPSIFSVITCSRGAFPDEVGWSLSCSDGTTLSGGAPYASSSPLAVALGAMCTLNMIDLGRAGSRVKGAVWAAPGFGQSFPSADGSFSGT